ncbi:MAG TPA: glycosyltransferase family 39 protein [Solirubrobacteraceae bacterium]|nr:glycosyltransferase family 39 protein [Solirubrobacteraceae bacterium]
MSTTETERPPIVEAPADSSLGQRARERAISLSRNAGPEHVAILLVLALSAVLEMHGLSRNGWANIFYSAAVRSELHSLHDFFFVSFDPGGLITVDKPELGLWVQVISAKIFGLSTLSLLLPEAIATVISVAVMYRLVGRRFGPWSGVAAALALATFPSLVAVSRDNNVDAVLIVFMVIGCALGVRACETGRLRTLVAAAVFVALAFNVKSLAAAVVIPGLGLAYMVCAPGEWRRRIVHLLVAGAICAVVSLWWLTAVDLTRASHRPYVGSTEDNSEYGLAFVYNGFGRVGGQVGGPGQVITAVRLPNGQVREVVHHVKQTPVAPGGPQPFGGATGPLRIFGSGLGDQGGWLVPFALIGLIAALLTVRRRDDPRLAATIIMGAWFLAELYVLDFGKGIIHPYYVSALGPGVAGMLGIGAASMVDLIRRGHPALRILVPALAVALTVASERSIMRYFGYHPHWVTPLAIAAGVATIALIAIRRTAPLTMAALLGVLIVAPAAYATTVWHGPVDGTFPAAGDSNAKSDIPHGAGRTSTGADERLVDFIRTHAPPTMRWSLLTQDSLNAAPLILLGMRVAALAGYNGSDPAVSPRRLAQMVATGQARYIEVGGAFSQRGGNAATTAVRVVCRTIPPSDWGGPIGGIGTVHRHHRVGAVASPSRAPRHSSGPAGPLGSQPPRAALTFNETGIALYDCQGDASALAAQPGFN